MKKIIIALMALSMPLFINAQSSGLFSKKKIASRKDLTEYMQGAVPTVGEKVVFNTTISAPGKSKAELYSIVSSWANLRYTANQARGEWNDADFFKNTEYAEVRTADKQNGSVVCNGAEEMVFSNKALAKDYTYIYYTLKLNVADGKIIFNMDNIAYLYAGGSENPERMKAEDWITDAYAFNKKGELHRINGKFRVKTVDLKDELIKELSEAVK